MAYTREASRQRYSSELAAYTLKQFSAARAALDNHKTAAAKLPAINSFDYRILNPDTSSRATVHPLADNKSRPTH